MSYGDCEPLYPLRAAKRRSRGKAVSIPKKLVQKNAVSRALVLSSEMLRCYRLCRLALAYPQRTAIHLLYQLSRSAKSARYFPHLAHLDRFPKSDLEPVLEQMGYYIIVHCVPPFSPFSRVPGVCRRSYQANKREDKPTADCPRLHICLTPFELR